MPRASSHLRKLHSRSKKIQKPKPKKTARPEGRKYQTYSKTKKKEIISKVHELVNSISGNAYPEEDLVEGIEALHINDYNKILIKVFSQYPDSSLDSFDETEKLKRMRRRMKEWIKSQKKPETRGDPLIPFTKLQVFKKRLIPILRRLCCRNFRILSKKILQICKQIGIQRTSCSKHFWYNFLKRNQDISAIYETVSDKKCFNHLDTEEDENSEISIEEQQTQHSVAYSSPDIYIPKESFGHSDSPFINNFQMQEATDDPNNLSSPSPGIRDSLLPQDIIESRFINTFEINLRRALELDFSSQMNNIVSSKDQPHTACNIVEQQLETSFIPLEPDKFLDIPVFATEHKEFEIRIESGSEI